MSVATTGATRQTAVRGAGAVPRATQAASRPRLRVVAPPRPAPRRAPFVVLVLVLLVAGLGTLLLLNTVLAQGAFRVEDLQRQVSLLTEEEEGLQQQVARLAAPARLARQARALGMVPMTTPAFLRTSDGAVLGRARPATGVVPQWARPVAQPRPAPQAATVTSATPATEVPAARDATADADGTRAEGRDQKSRHGGTDPQQPAGDGAPGGQGTGR